ncbi:MAG: hypothetical protein IAE80_24210 [Anaerolinea sp.]|nr:hypothetical protein [Anaerolinea sp.]
MTTKTPVRQKKETVVKTVEKAAEQIVPVEAANAFDAFIDHQKKAIVEAGKALATLVPEDFKEHGQTAFQEVIEGYRKLFNATIDEIIDAMEKAKLRKPEAEPAAKEPTPVP